MFCFELVIVWFPFSKHLPGNSTKFNMGLRMFRRGTDKYAESGYHRGCPPGGVAGVTGAGEPRAGLAATNRTPPT
jgi:hypothetical protein